MKLAIMQPYFLPYIGYFQLIAAVDKFVVYDDVNFINKGWINRNQMMVNGQKYMFTIPLSNASQNKLIKEVALSPENNWKSKLLKTIEQAYKKAPHYNHVMPLIEEIIMDNSENIAKYNFFQLTKICDYLKIGTILIPSSEVYNNKHLKGQERILDICLKEGAQTYINPIGGMEIYDNTYFEKNEVDLFFIRSLPIEYTQFKFEFIPWMSVLDVMMHNTIETIQHYLKHYTLIKKDTL